MYLNTCYLCLRSIHAIEQAIFSKLDGGPAALADYDVRDFQPFDPVSKRTEAQVKGKGAGFKISKGAPQVMLSLVQDADETLMQQVTQAVDAFATKGYRALALG